jgi:hypothetical protein
VFLASVGGGDFGVGSSYEGLLVVGERDVVVDALADGGVTAFVVPAAPGRIAVIPKEEQAGGVADVATIAALLSGRHGLPVLVHDMYDSDLLSLWVYEQGVVVHEYISEMGHVGEVEETNSGFVRVIDGVTYAPDDKGPVGPRGADPDKLVPFGVGTIDRERLGRLLKSAPDWVYAHEMHVAIAMALNLAPDPLITDYHWVERGEVALDTVHIAPR